MVLMLNLCNSSSYQEKK